MINAPTLEDRQTVRFTFALWIWTVVAAFVTAEAAAKLWAHEDGALNGWAFIWGLLAGALTVLPFWAVYGLGRQLLRNLTKLRTDLALESQAAAQKAAEEAQKAAADAQMKAAAAAALAEAATPAATTPATEPAAAPAAAPATAPTRTPMVPPTNPAGPQATA